MLYSKIKRYYYYFLSFLIHVTLQATYCIYSNWLHCISQKFETCLSKCSLSSILIPSRFTDEAEVTSVPFTFKTYLQLRSSFKLTIIDWNLSFCRVSNTSFVKSLLLTYVLPSAKFSSSVSFIKKSKSFKNMFKRIESRIDP